MHWSEEIAQRIIARNPGKEEYVCAAGISPSGSVHIGNFRDLATPLFVVKALEKEGIAAACADSAEFFLDSEVLLCLSFLFSIAVPYRKFTTIHTKIVLLLKNLLSL